MLFQESALFDSLTVAENVGYRLYEEMNMPFDEARARIDEVLGFVGLAEYVNRMPSELSGGQRRRVAIARAMAHKPRLLLLDDPTYGLDPVTAAQIDDQILKLRDIERVTSLVATHGIRDAYHLASHEAVMRNGQVEILELGDDARERTTFMMLRDGRVFFEGTGEELRTSNDPYLREFMFMTLPPWGSAPGTVTSAPA
jgi:phospholipid/cholesterol/gamma-HCH transport system ATP-binding protein